MNEAAAPEATIPIFSERLTDVLDTIFKGEAPNAGRFCGYCFTPVDLERTHCMHCGEAVERHPPVERVPKEVLEMFRQLRRRESLVVNGFAYLGLALAVLIFTAVFYVIFTLEVSVWWYAADTLLLFVLARGLAGLIGGWIGDEVGFRYARRKLAEDWQAYEAEHNGGAGDA